MDGEEENEKRKDGGRGEGTLHIHVFTQQNLEQIDSIRLCIHGNTVPAHNECLYKDLIALLTSYVYTPEPWYSYLPNILHRVCKYPFLDHFTT